MLVFEKELSAEFQSHFDQAKVEFDNFQKIGTNALNLNFNITENLPCARTYFDSSNFKRLDVNVKTLKCPLCQSVSLIDSKGQLCNTCQLCTLGEEVLGMKLQENYE